MGNNIVGEDPVVNESPVSHLFTWLWGSMQRIVISIKSRQMN